MIGRQLLLNWRLFFLINGITLAIFQQVGNCPRDRDVFIKRVNGLKMILYEIIKRS
jgi:hypothetical protein